MQDQASGTLPPEKMADHIRSIESVLVQRRRRVLRAIKGEAALFVSSPPQHASRDQFHPYVPSSDLFYLTGIREQDVALLLLGGTRGPRSLLYLRDRDPVDERWHGERIGLKRAKRRFQVDEVRSIADLRRDLPELLADARVLHYAAGTNATYDTMVWELFRSAIGPRTNFPNSISDARLLTAEMRSVKDRLELRTIQHAVDITAHGFLALAPKLREVTSEAHAARLLESHFTRLGAHGLAFETIVASGKNATVLHHRPLLQPLWKRELVLVDAGASFRGYTGDITRTFPVSGKFTKPQAEIYDIVNRSLDDVLAVAKAGVSLDDLHEVCVRSLIRGLTDLGILKGAANQLFNAGEHRRYYMHRTSHWLGIDVHDIAPVSFEGQIVPSALRPLVAGNVFTVEPGLYFDPKDPTVPAEYRGIGIRIEEDVHVTNSGIEVLSAKVPRDRDDIEQLLA